MLVQIPDPGSVPSWVCLGKLLLRLAMCRESILVLVLQGVSINDSIYEAPGM